METITAQEDIEAFVSALNLEDWTLNELPDGAAEIGSFGLSQEGTVKLGQAQTDGTRYDIGTLTLYDGPYIDFEIAGLHTTFTVSEETADGLRDYFE